MNGCESPIHGPLRPYVKLMLNFVGAVSCPGGGMGVVNPHKVRVSDPEKNKDPRSGVG